MKRKKIVLLILLPFYFLGYSQETNEVINPNGFITLYYPNGRILSEGNMKEGKPDGYWKTYYTTGIIKSEGNRKNFLLDSIWIFYNSTGDTLSKINYILGKKNGYYYEYVTDRSKPENIGNITSKELFVNDIKEGQAYYYYNNGKIKETINYGKDKPDGISIEYAEDGRIITIKRYSKGSLVERQKVNRYDDNNIKIGEWLDFYEGIKVKSESNYKNGLLDGYYKEYNENGKLILTLLYDKGKLVEKVKEDEKAVIVREKVDDKGNIIESGPYIDDIPVGIHKSFDKDGNIKGSRIYSDQGVLLSEGIIDKGGKREGPWKDYYLDGNLKASGQYKNNFRIGKWTFLF